MPITLERRITARLRPKNQLTLPTEIVKAVGAAAGDRFFVTSDGPDRVVLERLPRSYAGSLAGLWGSAEAVNVDVRAIRGGWAERERRQLGE